MKKSIIFSAIFIIVILFLFKVDVIGLWGLIGLFFLLIFIYTLWSDHEKNVKKKIKNTQLDVELKSLDGFNPTKKMVSHGNLIAIDNSSEQLVFGDVVGNFHKYHYSKILSCEIIEDGETTYKKSSTVGRAIVGGVLAGGVGAIIGGLTGKEKENKEIKYLDLKIVVKDTTNPNFTIRFFDAWEETHRTKKSVKISDSTDGPKLKNALANLEKWKDSIEVIIDQMNSATKAKSENQLSVSDELLKLAELKEKGVLTEEEFQQQKRKLLE